jgi:glycosyltransferase involved in cell wall biosynthesis
LHIFCDASEENFKMSNGKNVFCSRSGIEPSTPLGGIIFSKDRPLQLDATLRSFYHHCSDAQNVQLYVLYTTTTGRMRWLYRQLIREYPRVAFVRESDFRRDLLTLLGNFEHVLFLVDDSIFAQPFALGDILDALQSHPDAIGFSLRLGRNTTYCYSLDRKQALPELQELNNGFLKFSWLDAPCDFGYPLELSSSAYRVEDIRPLLEELSFENPNTLEDAMSRNLAKLITSHPSLLCSAKSLSFCIPINLVQKTCLNRAGHHDDYMPEKLAQLFAEGCRLDIAALDGYIPKACHEEVALTYTRGALVLPKVSVVIPCYKQAHFLGEAVASVVSQSFVDWEIVVVNDGSPDNTSGTARELMVQHPNCSIRLIEKSNGGLADARNAGIRAANGMYILPLDADDKIEPAMLEKTVDFLENNPQISIAYSDIVHFGATHRMIQAAEYDFVKLCSNNQLNYCSLYRYEMWESVGGYNPNMSCGYEDWDFWIGCGAQGWVAHRVGEPLLLYRVKESSMYTDAVAHDEQLRAQIVLNHPNCYGDKDRLKAIEVLSANPLPRAQNAPTVSVIVTTFCRPARLRESLLSILEQTFRDYEIIVVNDAGVDVEYVIAGLRSPQQIRYLRHSRNQGVAAARNTGMRLALGTYIAYLDDDDIFLPEHLERLVTFLQKSGAKAAYTDAYCAHVRRENGGFRILNRDIPFSFDWDNDTILVRNFVPVLCFMYERITSVAIGEFDESLTTHEDWDLWIRLSRICRPEHLKDVTCEFRVVEDGSTITSTLQADFLRTMRIIHRKYRRYAADKRTVIRHQRRTEKALAHKLRDVTGENSFTSSLADRWKRLLNTFRRKPAKPQMFGFSA